jgi:hypothetical protein
MRRQDRDRRQGTTSFSAIALGSILAVGITGASSGGCIDLDFPTRCADDAVACRGATAESLGDAAGARDAHDEGTRDAPDTHDAPDVPEADTAEVSPEACVPTPCAAGECATRGDGCGAVLVCTGSAVECGKGACLAAGTSCSCTPAAAVDALQSEPAKNGSWDWNCDGVVTKDARPSCSTNPDGSCAATAGLEPYTSDACGAFGWWCAVETCRWEPAAGECRPIGCTAAVMRCR